MIHRPPMVVLLSLALVATGALGACHQQDGHAIELPSLEQSAIVGPTLDRVQVEELRTSEPIVASGTVEPARIVTVGSPLMARVDAVNVEEGAVVEPGDVMVRLDTTAGQLQVAQARANVATTRVQLERAMADVERYTPLAVSGVVSQQQVDQLGSQRDALRESIEAGEAMVSLARSQVSDGTVRAPFRATVTEIPVDVGAMASPGGALVRLVDMSEVDVRVRLAESEMRAVHTGMTLPVRAPGLGIEAEGVVRFVDPELNAADRTGEVLVRVNNESGQWLAGAFAEVTLPRPSQAEVRVLPRDAVLRTGAGTFVLVPEGEGYRRRTVVAEAMPDGRWRIESGLGAGDEVARGALADARGVISENGVSDVVGAQEESE